MRPRRPVALAVAALALAGLGAGCGGDDAEQRAADSKAYAGQVSRISTATGDRLAELSGSADYRDAKAAADSTRAYAASIREAATRLRAAEPPERVRTLHDALVKLYEQTARSLDALATRFATASDPVELAAGAQELSTQIQRLASREQGLRDGIERGLVASTSPEG